MMKSLTNPTRKFRAALLFCVCCIGVTTTAQARTVDGIAAIVGDDIVLFSELAARMQEVEAQLAAQGTPSPARDVLQQQVLERVILRKLQLQRAKQRGITVTDLEVTDALGSIAKRNGVSASQMQAAMQAEGIDISAYQEEIRDELAIAKLRQREIEGRVSVSEGDVDLYMEAQRATMQEEYHLRHILIGAPTDATPAQKDEARARAQQVLDALRSGQDFAQAAVAHSQGQQALNGGDLGWRTAAALPTMFANKVPAMQEGEISNLIESRSGFHIIRVDGKRRGPGQIRRSEVKARHILLAPTEMRDLDSSKAEAQRLYDALIRGADFAELARQNSDDPGSASEGGELGWQSPDAFVTEFQQKAEQLRVGEISEPFQSPFGWHILQIQDRREKKGAPQAEREAAREEIFQRKATEEYELWLRRLRDEAYIEYRL